MALAQKLGKKVGPFPLWVWLGAGAGTLLALYLYLRTRSADAGGSSAGPLELVTGSGLQPQDYASAGAPSQNGAPGSMLAPEIANQLQNWDSQLSDIRESLGEIQTTQTSQLEPDFAGNLNLEDLVRSTIESMGGVQPTPAPPAGVRWGGQIFTTRAGITRELQRTGGNYRTWAQRHPGAAKKLTGPVPKPKKKPQRSAPQAKRPPQKKPPKKPPVKRKPPAQPRAGARR